MFIICSFCSFSSSQRGRLVPVADGAVVTLPNMVNNVVEPWFVGAVGVRVVPLVGFPSRAANSHPGVLRAVF